MKESKTRPKPRRMEKVKDPEILMKDIEKYVTEAIRLGSTDSIAVRASDLVIDERVRAK